jgi:hypothetical protein
MGLQSMIPQVWSARLMVNLDKSHVYGQSGVVNRDYEGEITAFGDTVKISQIGEITISNYTKNTALGTPQFLDAAQTVMVIDQAKAFNFAVDDIDQVQTKPKVMDRAMQRAAYGLSDTADQFLAALMVAAVPSGNTVGTTGAPKTDLGTAGKAYEYLLQLGTKLDEDDVPSEGRFAILPPWYFEQLGKDSTYLINGSPAGDNITRNGYQGQLAGFNLYKSNNVPNTGSSTLYKIVAGTDLATSFAEQIISVEGYRPEQYFSDAVKGLHVYGGKVVLPNALAMLIANRP